MACQSNKIKKINIHEFVNDKIINKLNKTIDRKRFLHSLSVAEISVLLAREYKVNLKKAALAGLLHDCAKSLPYNKAQKYLYKLKVDNLVKENPSIWHAYTGYLYAKKFFGIKDREILNAIKFHTVGFSEMSKLAKIIYIADFFAEDRKFIKFKTLDNLLKKNILLDKLTLFVLKEKILFLIKNERKIHINAIKLFNKLLSK